MSQNSARWTPISLSTGQARRPTPGTFGIIPPWSCKLMVCSFGLGYLVGPARLFIQHNYSIPDIHICHIVYNSSRSPRLGLPQAGQSFSGRGDARTSACSMDNNHHHAPCFLRSSFLLSNFKIVSICRSVLRRKESERNRHVRMLSCSPCRL